ncbi:contractile injection system protein, VgrG/Pvc8 family [Thalassospira marina]|uniref:Late control protein n=1 Tax=Thalassospira marina TaxID=2048283 RepID=A0A2N3KX64_9PROT|nr:contractile injection system protein, VgrG/Pvc8 family [Thalassospira marina]PKR55066.1 late control protein [Thalassospira marina]
MTTPAFRIVAGGSDITPTLNKYLVSLRLTDKTGLEADQLEIEIADEAGEIALPPPGITLQVWIGYRDALVDKGTYIVDQVRDSGSPDKITITAHSADFQGAFKVQREQSYHGNTLGDILRTIADRQNLKPAIEPGLAAIAIDHIDQTNESDINFLTRLGKDYDAIATVKAGHLLFIPLGYNKTVSGIALPAITVHRSEGDQHDFTLSARDADITGVRGKWRDKSGNQNRYSTAGEGPNWKTLKREYPNASQAFHAAKTAWANLKRGKREISLSIAMGRADIAAGRLLQLSGWKQQITDVTWVINEVTHSLNDSGFTTSLNSVERVSI